MGVGCPAFIIRRHVLVVGHDEEIACGGRSHRGFLLGDREGERARRIVPTADEVDASDQEMLSVRRERQAGDVPRAVGVAEGIQIIKKPRLHFQMFDHGGRCIEHWPQLFHRRCLVAIRRAGVGAGEQAERPALHDVPKANAIIAARDQRAPVRSENEAMDGAREVGEGERFLAARALPQHPPFKAAQIIQRSRRGDEADAGRHQSLRLVTSAATWHSQGGAIRHSLRPVFVQEPACLCQVIRCQSLGRGIKVRRVGALAGVQFTRFRARRRCVRLLLLLQGVVSLACQFRSHH